MTKPTDRFFRDLMFYAVADVFDYRVEFKIYDVTGLTDGECPVFGLDFAGTLEEAEVYASGEVKWDGCSNWRFDEQDNCRLHACDRAGLTRLGEVLARCRDWAAEICPHADAELFRDPRPL